MPSVIIDQFPFGSPGAPTSGAYQGSVDNTAHNVLGDSIWNPFNSECDWDIARWARKHNLTSSAMAEFLAMPKVRNCLFICYFPINVSERSSGDSAYHTARPRI